MQKPNPLLLLVFAIAAMVFIFRVGVSRRQDSRDMVAVPESRESSMVSNLELDVKGPEFSNETIYHGTAQSRSSQLRTDGAGPTPAVQRFSAGRTNEVSFIASAEDLQIFAKVLGDPSDDDTVRNEVANLLRRSKYTGLTNALHAVLDNPAEKPRFRSFAVQHLWQQLDGAGIDDQDRIRAKLHELLADRHVEVRREALLALVRMRDPVGKTTAIGWLTSLEPSAETTRDLAIRCVYDLGLREQMQVIRPFARDPNEVTRIAAIVALSQWGDEGSREAFKAAADSSSIRLQRAGKAALERLNQQEHQPPMASTESAPKELKDEDAK